MIHARNLIEKDLGIQLTIKSGCFKFYILKVRSRKIILVINSRLARLRARFIIANIVGSLSVLSIYYFLLNAVHPSG